MEDINVEQIMEGIRNTIPDQEEKWKTVRFSDIPIDAAGDYAGARSKSFDLAELEQGARRSLEYNNVSFFQPLEGHAYTIPVKKVIRKLIRAIVEPICRCVSMFQNAASRAIGQVVNFVIFQQAENKALRSELANLRRQMKEMELRVEDLEKKQA